MYLLGNTPPPSFCVPEPLAAVATGLGCSLASSSLGLRAAPCIHLCQGITWDAGRWGGGISPSPSGNKALGRGYAHHPHLPGCWAPWGTAWRVSQEEGAPLRCPNSKGQTSCAIHSARAKPWAGGRQ